MCDWEGCTTATNELPNPNQRSVVKTSGFLHPYIYTGIPLGFPGTDSWRSRVRDNLDEAAIAAGNRTIFSAHGILAKHRLRKASFERAQAAGRRFRNVVEQVGSP